MLKTFHIFYRDRQGVLMRILNEVSRRGIAFKEVIAIHDLLTLTLDINKKQEEQLCRAWRATIDVDEVRAMA
jgi:ACT domain-containing protein